MNVDTNPTKSMLGLYCMYIVYDSIDCCSVVLWYHSMQQRHKVDTKMDIWKASFFFTKSSYLVE